MTNEINPRYMGKLVDAKLLPKDENGNTCCRWCNKPVLPPRRTMCSPECVHELSLRINGRYLRNCVYERDKGVCAICKIDTKITAKQARELTGKDLDEFLKKYGISKKRKLWVKKHGGGLWDADHIIPVKDGGGMCGLDNIRTLCIMCHKNVTYKK
jgi:5-methylcytosine-specific restriction protein A